MVQAPVGTRCAQCARLSRLPTFVVTPGNFAKGVLAGLGATVVCGIIWNIIRLFIPIMLLNLAVAAGVGYGIGLAISYSVNRKRSTGLKTIASVCVLIAYIIGNQLILPGQFVFGFNLFNTIAIAIGIYLAVSQL